MSRKVEHEDNKIKIIPKKTDTKLYNIYLDSCHELPHNYMETNLILNTEYYITIMK